MLIILKMTLVLMALLDKDSNLLRILFPVKGSLRGVFFLLPETTREPIKNKLSIRAPGCPQYTPREPLDRATPAVGVYCGQACKRPCGQVIFRGNFE